MLQYLLGTAVLRDLLRRMDGYPTMQWAEQTSKTTAYISVISVGAIKALIERKSSTERNKILWMHSLDDMERTFDRRILPVDLSTVKMWSKIYYMDLPVINAEGKTIQMSSESRIVIATAMARNMTVVDYKQPCHDVLATLGVIMLDPRSSTVH